MIKYTIEETTANTCPPCPPPASRCRCSRCAGGGSSGGRQGQHPAVEFIAGSVGLAVLYFVLKFALSLAFHH